MQNKNCVLVFINQRCEGYLMVNHLNLLSSGPVLEVNVNEMTPLGSKEAYHPPAELSSRTFYILEVNASFLVILEYTKLLIRLFLMFLKLQCVLINN